MDSDIENDDNEAHNNPRNVWMVNKGIKRLPGDILVDMILNQQKPVLYMSPKIKNCIDSWIFLREIRCQNSIHNKRVRCCIKICRPFIPLTDKAWYRPEWGWDDSENSTQITLGKDGWVAFRITAIKKLRAELTGVEQSNQGSPWLLMTDPSHALETSKLLSASVLASYPIFSPNT